MNGETERMREEAAERVTAPGKARCPRLLIGCVAAVLLLGLWHFFDVRAGAAATGAFWLSGRYLLVLAAGLAGLLFAGYLLTVRRAPLERAFVASVLCLGVLYMTVLPPLSAPDEISHYISAYQLSSRLLGKPAHDGQGRVYIRPQDAFVEDLDDVMADDGSGERMAVSDPAARILGQELTQETYRQLYEWGRIAGRQPAGDTEGAAAQPDRAAPAKTSDIPYAVSYQYPVRTTPLAYLPQALGLALGRLLGVGAIGLLYLGRFFNLLFYTGVGYLAMRRLPFGKGVLFGVALLPMSLHLAASFSYDVLLLSMSALFTAVCLDLAFRADRVRLRDVLLLAAIMAVMGPCKMVYGVIMGLCLLIPVKKFGGWRGWGLSAAAVLGAFLAAMALVNLKTVALYTADTQTTVAWSDAPGYTFAELIHRPYQVLRLCYETLVWQGGQFYEGLLGGALGNMDPVLNTPYLVLLPFTVILLLLALEAPGERRPFTIGARLWIWFLCLACLGALMFSMLLTWTPVTATTIQGVQGRYLLPLLPIFLLTLSSRSLRRQSASDPALLLVAHTLSLYTIIRLFSVVVLRV